MNNLTPEQYACIRQATEALEKLRDIMPVEEPTQKTDNLTPEEVFMIVTCNGQREMTLERFKDAIIRLSPVQKKYPDCKQCGWPVYNFTDSLCTSCWNRMYS